MSMEEFLKLAPFARRAGVAVTGRERLKRLGKRLAFIWATEDASDRTLRELADEFRCPIVRCLSSADVERAVGFRGTKVVGFLSSPLATSLYRASREQQTGESET